MKKLAFLSASIALTLSGAGADKITYNDQVLPIFRNACLNCHNPDKKKAGLDLSTYQGTLAGSENGKVLDSGNASGSLLFKCVKGTEEPKMPPKGDRLNDAELAILEKWITGQLLETATGKAVAAAANNVKVAVVSLERPDGPPPMPGELPLEPFVKVARKNALTALAASPWAPLVAIGGQKQIVLYNTDTLEPLGVLPFPEGFPAIIRFSRNGQILLTGGGQGGKSGKVVLWDIKSGERIATLGNEFDQVLGADLSPDQQFVALGGPGKLVKIYSTKDGKLVHSIKKHTDWVTAIAYSPDGQYLASADRNGGILIWEGNTGKEFNSLPGHKVTVTSLAFMTGVVASASEDGTVKLWDVKEAKEIRSWNAHAGGTAWVDFSPDGRLVSCGRDKIAKVWDQTGKMLGQTPPFGDIALRVAIANERVIAGDWNGEIRVTSLDGKPLGELSANPLPIAESLAPAQTRLAEATAAATQNQQAFAAAEAALQAGQAAIAEKRKSEETAAAAAKTAFAQVEKRLAEEKTQLAEWRKAAESGPEPERPAALEKATAQTAKIAKSEGELAAAKQALEAADKLAAAPLPKPNEEPVAKAKAALDQSSAQLLAAKGAVEKWTRAQAFMGVHHSRQSLLEKQARYEELLSTIKDALLPADEVARNIESTEKALADTPAQLKEKEAAALKAKESLAALTDAVTKGAAEVTALEAQVKSATEAFDKATAAAAEVTKKIAAQTEELEALRAERAKAPINTPEYIAADAVVQGKKPALAESQAAFELAQKAAADLKPQAEAARAPIAQKREVLEKNRLEIRPATDAAAAAEKAVAEAKKSVETLTAKLAGLRKEKPGIIQNAKAAKSKAEREVVVAEKELQAARAQTEKIRADYETRWKSGEKSAANVPAPAPKS